ncbi:hypothetical protein ACD661_03360 [Legionella lytica]|uniref:Uncharacterized protein n=1 Tax=Legionella lytica TaxID=96232 RepID=A0ABW8D4H4_9GAMM
MYTILISSLYPNSLIDQEIFNEEVELDRQTVKALFSECIELNVPAGSLNRTKLTQQKAELSKLMRLLKEINESEVTIVLNTHGVPGKYDIDTSFITALVQQLSAEHIKINTLYALMCDGFTKRKATDDTARYRTSISEGASPKPSSMAILRTKLNNLETKIEQFFPIKGFSSPYTPNQANSMIIKFLRNENVGETIYAHTKEQKGEDFRYLLNCIILCRNAPAPNNPAYIKASNALGILLHEIRQHINKYLNGIDEGLYKGAIPLFKEVVSFAKLSTDNLTAIHFEHQYKRWIKEYKLTSTKRLDILEGYCYYEKQIQEVKTTYSAMDDRITFFAGKISLSDEPTSGIEAEQYEAKDKRAKM